MDVAFPGVVAAWARHASSLLVLLLVACGGPADDPWSGVPQRPPATPHDTLIQDGLAHRAGALDACLSCHADEGAELPASVHAQEDCLACHLPPDRSAALDSVDSGALVAAVRQVARPTPASCESCHAVGGPAPGRGVHLDEHGLVCTDCHRTTDHQMRGPGGRSGSPEAVSCTDCHAPDPHRDDRWNRHTAAVACTTCHIPRARIGASYGWYRGEAGLRGSIDDPLARIWPLDSLGPVVHEIPEAGQAFTCRDCHTRLGVLDWEALGYPGDPASEGGRRTEASGAEDR